MKRLLTILSMAASIGMIAQDPCSQLTIDVQLNPLNSNFIRVYVQNSSTEIFSYPGFRIYDEDNNLIGEELVNLFGIGEESIHDIEHTLGEIQAGEAYTLSLELWTGFYESMACTFEDEFVLVPEDECANIGLTTSQIWGMEAQENYLVSIMDLEGNSFFDAVYEFPNENLTYFDEICLPQGCYELNISTDDAMISNTLFATLSVGFSTINVHDSALVGTPFTTIPFGVWDSCVSTDINRPGLSSEAPLLYPNPARTWVMIPFENAQAEVYSVEGKLVTKLSAVDRELNVSELSAGQYIVLLMHEGRGYRHRLIKY